jgi:hypothetical protein
VDRSPLRFDTFLRANDPDFDFQWNLTDWKPVNSGNSSKLIRYLDWDARQITLPTLLFLNDERTGTKAVDQIDELFGYTEGDIVSRKMGYLVIGDKDIFPKSGHTGAWYCECYLTIETTERRTGGRLGDEAYQVQLSMVTDKPYWKRYKYSRRIAEDTADTGLDYANNKSAFAADDQGADYANIKSGQTPPDQGWDYLGHKYGGFVNGLRYPCDFKLVFNGPGKAPYSLKISQPTYSFTYLIKQGAPDLKAAEKIVVDADAFKVEKLDAFERRQNLFNYRDRENYIFTQIPPGKFDCDFSGCQDVEVYLVEKSSQPYFKGEGV